MISKKKLLKRQTGSIELEFDNNKEFDFGLFLRNLTIFCAFFALKTAMCSGTFAAIRIADFRHVIRSLFQSMCGPGFIRAFFSVNFY